LLKKIIILKKVSHILTICLVWILCLFSLNLLAQDQGVPPPADTTLPVPTHGDSVAVKTVKDSLAIKTDSVVKADTVRMDSLKVRNEKGDIETTIYYHAEDSIMMDVANKKAYLYGKAQIKYQQMKLDAERIEIKWDQNIITARGKIDSTGKYVGYPVWVQGVDTYVTDSMRYNMKTSKGIIHGIVTKQGEGFLHGDTAKRTEEAIFLKNGVYTTCDRKHPHFYINARKLKVIPEDKALCGPFNMVIEDIPTPIGFWLGFFPITDKKKSGIVFPTFGENQSRGMFFSKGGYYWAINDYIGLEVVADVYANGTWLLDASSTYTKRYKYRGNFDASAGKIKNGFDNKVAAPYNFKVAWTHSTIAARNGKFTASVNLSSSKYDKSLNYTPNRTNNTTNSSITYSRVLGRTPFSTSISMRATQNNFQSTATNTTSAIYNVTLPAASLNMNRINPFKRRASNGSKWYEKIFVNYQGNFNYDLKNNQPIIYDPLSRTYRDTSLQINNENLKKYILPRSVWTSTHSASVSSTFKLLKVLNLNPSFNNYYNLSGKKLKFAYDTSLKDKKVVDTSNGIYGSYYMNMAVTLNTRIYGTKQFKGNGLIKGIRHTVNPGVTFTYAPDFSKINVGGYTPVRGDLNNEGVTKRYFQYLGSGPPQGKQEVLDFTLTNILEAKVRNRKDTTGTNKYKKINLLDNFGITGGYNLGADSLKMKPIVISARTKLFGKFNINFNSTYNPYMYYAPDTNGNRIVAAQRVINKYVFAETGKLANLENMNFNVSTNFKSKKGGNKQYPKFNNNAQMQADLNYIKANPNLYIDFTVPWTLNLNYTYNYTHVGFMNKVINQTITATGDLSLTPKWKILFSTGYNINQKAITVSNFTFSRDLHCWQMNMTLSPFGTYRTFLFTISAKSQLLQTLKLNKRAPTFIQ
jgi:hypothetical protein